MSADNWLGPRPEGASAASQELPERPAGQRAIRGLVFLRRTSGVWVTLLEVEVAAQVQPVEPAIRVLIVDDDPIVRSALSSFVASAPDLELLGVAGDGAEALTAARADVVLMDVQMPVMNGIDATRALLSRDPEVRVLILTSFDTDAFLLEALRAGAAGFMLKATTPEALVEAIRGVSRGNTVLSPSSAAVLLRQGEQSSEARTAPAHIDLSLRERDILRELCSGASNLEIAESLYLSESTVKTHVSSIMGKLGVSSRLKVVVKAHEWGLLDEAAQ